MVAMVNNKFVCTSFGEKHLYVVLGSAELSLLFAKCAIFSLQF